MRLLHDRLTNKIGQFVRILDRSWDAQGTLNSKYKDIFINKNHVTFLVNFTGQL